MRHDVVTIAVSRAGRGGGSVMATTRPRRMSQGRATPAITRPGVTDIRAAAPHDGRPVDADIRRLARTDFASRLHKVVTHDRAPEGETYPFFTVTPERPV